MDRMDNYINYINDFIYFIKISSTFAIFHLIYYLIKIIYIKFFCNYNNKIRQINDDCKICLDKFTYEVKLSCYHSYWAECILTHYRDNYKHKNYFKITLEDINVTGYVLIYLILFAYI